MAGLQYEAVAHIQREQPVENDEFRYRQWLEDYASPGDAGECTPPMDVIETAQGIELVVDLPGVPDSAINIVFSQGTLVIAGRKTPGVCAHSRAAFHLAERTFGRFVRALRINGAFDAGRAAATLRAGVLRILLPRIEERRGGEIRIAVVRD